MGVRDQLQSTLAAKLHVATASGCNSATLAAPVVGVKYGQLTSGRLFSDLVTAIRHACRARGDSDALCQELIADCANLPRAHQLDLLDHFRSSGALTKLSHQPPKAG